MPPHTPGWLGDVAEVLVSRFEAEAILLVGSQARGNARPEGDYNLLVIVDDDHAGEGTGHPLSHRLEALPGFQRPVAYLRATLAEVMAGLYAGVDEWEALTFAAHPIVDPLGMAGRILGRRREPTLMRVEAAIGVARDSSEAIITAASLGRTLEALLMLSQSVTTLAREIARYTAPGEATPSRVADALQTVSPVGARALRSALSAPDPSAGADTLVKAANAFADALRQRVRTVGGDSAPA